MGPELGAMFAACRIGLQSSQCLHLRYLRGLEFAGIGHCLFWQAIFRWIQDHILEHDR